MASYLHFLGDFDEHIIRIIPHLGYKSTVANLYVFVYASLTVCVHICVNGFVGLIAFESWFMHVFWFIHVLQLYDCVYTNVYL